MMLVRWCVTARVSPALQGWEHLIRDERDFRLHMDYLHANPVKHGLVRSVADWAWSSFHRCVRQGVYPADWVGEVGDGVADVE